eukprot:s841_g5.t1
MPMRIPVQQSSGEALMVEVEPDMTVGVLKEQLKTFRSDDELTRRLMSVKVFVDNQELVDNEEAVMETVSREDAVVQVVFSRRVVECSQRESADRCLSDPDAVCILQIPEGVRVIDEFAFHDCKSVAVLYIPNSVTAIGKAAFHGCTSLTNVVIPNSVATIERGAFDICSSLKSLVIPESVTTIENGAFWGCNSLESLSIPESVTAIEKAAFCGCNSLRSLTIPNSVTAIGDSAFDGCSSLTSLTIPDSVGAIGKFSFHGCNSLTSLVIPESVIAIESRAFYGCSSLEILTIPESVTAIEDGAFNGCKSLTRLTIPSSVTAIGDSAFSECSSLTSLIIPNSVAAIGELAFHGCDSLTSLVISESVTAIAKCCFNWCRKLESLTIPKSVTAIKKEAFYDCSSLESLTIPESVTAIEEAAFHGCKSLTRLTIPNSVGLIGKFAFQGCSSLTSLMIPESVTAIEKGTFHGCSSLESLTIPESVTAIEEAAFHCCKSLRSLTIPSSVGAIGKFAFHGCNSLTSLVVIPSSVTAIGEAAFDNRSLMASVAESDPGCGAAVAALLGLAVGDSVGGPLEFLPVDGTFDELDATRPCVVRGQRDGDGRLTYRHAYNRFHLKPGQWTDDTSMALCLADSLLVKNGYDGGDLRVRWHMWWFHGYCNAFRYDERRYGRSSVGLGGNVAKSLADVEYQATRRGVHHVPQIYGSVTNDAGNGSIMRLAPVPIAYHAQPREAMKVAILQSRASHPSCDAAACCAFMAFFVAQAITQHKRSATGEPAPSSDPKQFISMMVDGFLNSGFEEMEEYQSMEGCGRADGVQRISALLKCQPLSRKEANWDWKAKEPQISQAVTARLRDRRYNGHPIIDTYWGAYCMDGLAMAMWGLWHSSSEGY